MLRHNTAEVIGIPNNNNNSKTSALHNNMNVINTNITTSNSTGSNSNNLSSNGGGNPLDALPKQFLFSMKTLFDILDDQRTGFVRFTDIEKDWQDDGCKGLPRGVMDSLRKVTPASGMLSFERFCAGLKLCLLRNQADAVTNPIVSSGSAYSITNSNHVAGIKTKSPIKPPRPPSAPLLDIGSPLSNVAVTVAPSLWNANLTATVHPHNIATTQRTLSMPQLSPDSELEVLEMSSTNVYNSPPPPPKPPRASVTTAAAAAAAAAAVAGGAAVSNSILQTVVGNGNGVNATTQSTVPMDKTEIRYALQNWQMGILLSEMDAKDKRKSSYTSMYNQFNQYRGCADGGSSTTTTDSITGAIAMHAAAIKKNNNKRREPRRHTLQNGIDYNMLKRLKQFEEEREVLLVGLDAVEKARDWYIQQVANVQEKIKYLGRMGHVEQWSEVQQERLNFQRARVLEVNRNLATLVDSWERGGFPLHFNLAIREPNKISTQRMSAGFDGTRGLLQPANDRLRQPPSNRHLISANEVVNLKSDERIAVLEREKQTLLRELFQLQQRIGLSSGRGNGFISSALSQSSPVCSSSSGGLGDADVVY